MRILYLASSVGPQGGGIGRVNEVLIDFLSRQDRVTVLCFSDVAPNLWNVGGNGLRYERFCTDKLRFVRAVSREILQFYDVVFFDHVQLAQLMSVFPFRLGRCTVVFLHGIEVWKKLNGLRSRALARADLLLANSCYTVRRARRYNPLIREVKVCPLGIGPVAPGLATQTLTPREGAILTVGRMSATEGYKGHEQLIRALPQVKRRFPGAHLMFVGTGDDVGRLRGIAERCGVAVDVKFAGFVPDAELGS